MFTTTEQDSIAWVEMNHGKVNAMDREFCEEFARLLDKMSQSDSIASMVLTGQGRIFSAGIDLKRLLREPESYVIPYLDSFERLIFKLFRFPKPIVAAVNGPAIAGGCILAAACDFRVGLESAKIGLPELRIGVPLPIICVEVMRSVLARQSFYEIVNIGATYHGKKAVEVGLLNELADRDNLNSLAAHHAQQLTAIPPTVFALSKEQLRFPYLSNAEQLTERIGPQIREIWQSGWLRKVIHEYVENRLRT